MQIRLDTGKRKKKPEEIFRQKWEQHAKRFQLNWYWTRPNENSKGTILSNRYIID